MSDFDLDKSSVAITAKNHYAHPRSVRSVKVTVRYPGHDKPIAYLTALIIDRKKCPQGSSI